MMRGRSVVDYYAFPSEAKETMTFPFGRRTQLTPRSRVLHIELGGNFRPVLVSQLVSRLVSPQLN